MISDRVIPTGGNSLARDTAVQQQLLIFKKYLDDPEITEIAVNKPGYVFFEKNSSWTMELNKDITVDRILFLGQAAATFTTQTWNKNQPLLSAALPRGERLQLAQAPAVEEGTVSLTLRKPASQTRNLDDFEKGGLFNEVRLAKNEVTGNELELCNLLETKSYKEFFKLAVQSRMNIVVSGATGSGKTTFMKGLVLEIPLNERLITIEDARELFLPHQNTVHLLYSKGGQSSSNVTSQSLLESCMRMKPDRILLAELRGDETLDYILAAASGHPGSITSCHAGSPALAFERLGLMIQKSSGGAALKFETIQRLLKLTIDIVVQFQNHNGKRFISEIYFNPQEKVKVTNGV